MNNTKDLVWGAYDVNGRLRATFDSESEAYFYTQNRGHMHEGTFRKLNESDIETNRIVWSDGSMKAVEAQRDEARATAAELLADMRKIARTYLADAHRIADAAIARATSTSSGQAERRAE